MVPCTVRSASFLGFIVLLLLPLDSSAVPVLPSAASEDSVVMLMYAAPCQPSDDDDDEDPDDDDLNKSVTDEIFHPRIFR